MAESELLCVSVATLLRNLYASVLRESHKAIHVRRFLFDCSRYLSSLNYSPGKKNNLDIVLAITLVRTS